MGEWRSSKYSRGLTDHTKGSRLWIGALGGPVGRGGP